jgi:uncharacterized membrane protein YhhN
MQHSDSFIHGLLAFLVGHIFYAVAFRTISKERRFLHQAMHLIPYLLWCGAVLWYLKSYGNLGSMFIPLCCYTMLLCVVCWFSSLAAIGRIAHADLPPQLWFWQKCAPVIGAVLFTTSDMMIAFDKFLPNFHSTSTSRLIYMILYYVGQAAIAYSTLE